MQAGSTNITKAYLGSIELTQTNAFIGTVPVIDGASDVVIQIEE